MRVCVRVCVCAGAGSTHADDGHIADKELDGVRVDGRRCNRCLPLVVDVVDVQEHGLPVQDAVRKVEELHTVTEREGQIVHRQSVTQVQIIHTTSIYIYICTIVHTSIYLPNLRANPLKTLPLRRF